MSVKFKPTQIAMPLSANYGRRYGKAVTLNNVTTKELADEIAHSTTATDFGALSCMLGMSTVYCYIVTCYIKVVFTMLAVFGNSSFGFTTREPRAEQCLRELRWGVDKNQIKPLAVFGAYRLVLRPVGALT